LWPPGTRSAYHYFTFGWLVGGCVEKISGKKFSEFFRDEISFPLGVENEMFFGRLNGLAVEKDRIASMEMELVKETFGGDEGLMATEESALEDSIGKDKEGGFSPPRGFLHMMADAIKTEDPIEGAALEELAHKLTRREFLLDPRLFNSSQIQNACIPSANGLFTAHALAVLHNNFLLSLGSIRSQNSPTSSPILSRECVESFRKYSASDSSATHRLFGMQNRIRFGLGCQLFGFKEENQRIRLSGFGHVGMGGSVALCDPATGLSFAMTVNMIRPGRKATVQVFEMVCNELNIGQPTPLFSS
jgi:aarF domain-containing kinase